MKCLEVIQLKFTEILIAKLSKTYELILQPDYLLFICFFSLKFKRGIIFVICSIREVVLKVLFFNIDFFCYPKVEHSYEFFHKPKLCKAKKCLPLIYMETFLSIL